MAVTAPLLALVLAGSGAAWSAWSSGWRVRTIATASMQPRFPVGTVVVVEPVADPREDVGTGDVLVFRDPADPGRSVAHRVVARLSTVGGGPVWQTKGDANPDVDPYPVHARDLEGRVRWYSPALGSALTAAGERGAAGVLLGVPLSLLVVSELIVRLRGRAARATSAAPAA